MKGKIVSLTFVLFLLMGAASAAALEATPGWESRCLNTTHLRQTLHIINMTDGDIIISNYKDIQCNYNCDTQRDVCWKWPGNAIPAEYYLVFEVFALSLLILGIWRLDVTAKEMKIFDVIIPAFMVFLFFMLALQGNNVIDLTTGEAVPVTMAIWLNYGFGVLSIAWFFFMIFKFAKGVVEDEVE